MSAIVALTCNNGSALGGVGSTLRGLTRSSGTSREGLDVKPSQPTVICGIAGCTNPPRSKLSGPCEKHYYRLRRTGTASLIDRKPTSRQDVARFTSCIEKTDGCWIWTGTVLSSGYGQFTTGRGKRHIASRYAHELWVGPIPKGYQVDHVRARGCIDTRCVNPDHLEAVTPTENVRRSTSPSAINRLKTHCKRGHEFSGVNTGYDTRDDRYCKECRRERQRALQQGGEWR